METTPSNADSLSVVIERRNLKLKMLFAKLGSNFRIIGNPNNPTVVMDESVVLSVWCHNFCVNFQDLPFKGNLLFSVKLTNHNTYSDSDIKKIINWLANPEYHRPAHKIAIACGDKEMSCSIPYLYLTGYNYINAEEKTGRYPVFANKCPKIYFTQSKAEEVLSELKKDGFDVFLDVDKIYNPTLK